MKYLYITGLEHSGTTLISQMLANAKGALALGEVGQFLSPTHMKGFMARWGQYPIAKRCSCGKDWEDCDFWSRHLDLYGLATGNESSLEARYIELIRRLHKDFPAAVIIDSSKSEANLRILVSGIGKSVCQP